MYHIHIVRPCGWGLEVPDVGTYLLLLGFNIGYENGKNHGNPDKQIAISLTQTNKSRIPAARNHGVKEAREEGATHLLMIDPDVAIDAFVGTEPWAKKWWSEAWYFAKRDGPPLVLTAPYAGQLQKVHVFYRDKEGVNRRYSWNDAGKMSGWSQVNAVGSGLMLIDMRVFDLLDKHDDSLNQHRPYFRDIYADERETELDYTPDVYFCERCREVGVPIWVNWDCWCGHWQLQRVTSPRCGTIPETTESEVSGSAIKEQGVGCLRRSEEEDSGMVEGGLRREACSPHVGREYQPDSPFGCSVCVGPWI